MTPPRFPDEFWSHWGDRAATGSRFGREEDSEHRPAWRRFPSLPAAAHPRATWEDDSLDAGADDFSHITAPHPLYVPRGYEPNYPYPLLIWLRGGGGNEQDLSGLMPVISDRNYFGLALHGPWTACTWTSAGFSCSQRDADLNALQAEIHDTVRRLRRRYHIHSERIYLAGSNDGAVTALYLLLRKPEWFAGAVAFGGRFPRQPHALKRFRDLRDKRVLMGVGVRDRSVSVTELVHLGRLFHAAGLDVTTRVYDAGHEVTRDMLRHIDLWIQEGIQAAQLV